MENAKKIVIDANTVIHTDRGPWDKKRVQRAICSSDNFLNRTILLIHSRQTRDEQRDGVTRHWNSRGWQMTDAKRGSRWAHFVSAGKGIREWEKGKVRGAMTKYWRQVLAQIAIKEGYTPVSKKSEL